jgi:hypothetical protein
VNQQKPLADLAVDEGLLVASHPFRYDLARRSTHALGSQGRSIAATSTFSFGEPHEPVRVTGPITVNVQFEQEHT